MQRRPGFVIIFFIFLILSLILLFFFQRQIGSQLFSGLSTVVSPVQRSFYSAFGGAFTRGGKSEHLAEENRKLTKQIVNQNELKKEAKALRDQYDSENIPSNSLVPVRVIGMLSFIPGISMPEDVIIDHGSMQGMKVGQTVILQDSLVGTISEVTKNRSRITLVTNKKQSFPAVATKTEALGIVRGKGNGIFVFENIVLSDKLEKGDIVVTKGSETMNAAGYPPGLVAGKITSVDKKASNLFQSAEIESLVDFARLDTVFVIKTD